jgi:hypothetical protein
MLSEANNPIERQDNSAGQFDGVDHVNVALAFSRLSKFRSGLGPDDDILGQWFDWLIARILLREATALIDVRLLVARS